MVTQVIEIGYTGNWSQTYFNGWVTGVDTSSGTFYYNGIYTVQDFYLPADWTKSPF